jgi:hypothetical protein
MYLDNYHMIICCYSSCPYLLSQPHFWKSVRMTFTFSKWGLGSPPGLPKLQSSIARVKTPRLEAFFMSLESYWSVDVENGLAWAIWTYVAQVMAKRRGKSQTGLQVCFRPHPNWRSKQRVMNSQSPASPNRDNFRTPPWESWDKKPFGCGCRRVTHRILYGGRRWLPPNPSRGESCESRIAHGLS